MTVDRYNRHRAIQLFMGKSYKQSLLVGGFEFYLFMGRWFYPNIVSK